MGKMIKNMNKRAPKTETKVFKVKQKPGIVKKKEKRAAKVKPALEKIAKKVNSAAKVEQKPGKRKTTTEAKDKCKLDAKLVKSGVKALKDLIEKTEEISEQPIFLQVNTVTIPQCPARVLKLPLKYPHTKGSAICLITPDLKGDVKAYKQNIEHYEELLKKECVAAKIKTIIPHNQLRLEYKKFESERRLVKSHDLFLVDGRLKGIVITKFTKLLAKHRKSLVKIQLNRSNLKGQIEKALLKVELPVHSKGDTYIVQVANAKMSNKEIFENVNEIFNALDGCFPGGAGNIRTLFIKTGSSLAIPVYVILNKPSEVNAPPKEARAELSASLQENIRVFTGGDVKVEAGGSKPKKPAKKQKGKKPVAGTPKKIKTESSEVKKPNKMKLRLQGKKANGVNQKRSVTRKGKKE